METPKEVEVGTLPGIGSDTPVGGTVTFPKEDMSGLHKKD